MPKAFAAPNSGFLYKSLIYIGVFVFFGVVFLALPGHAFAANRYWVGGSDGANTNSTSNWSATISSACGANTGASVPTSSDAVVFESTCTNGATINANFNAASITINASYTGTITQSSGVTITDAGVWSQSAGTFSGGDSTISIGSTFTLATGTFNAGSAPMSVTSTFTLTSGTFTSTSGTLTLSGNLTYTAGTFNTNSGTVSFSDAAHTIGGTFGLNNVTFNGSAARTYTISNTLTVAGTLSLTTTSTGALTINTGTINAQGDITISSGTGLGGGSATININGGGTQTLTGSGTEAVGALPNVTINKSTGTLNLSSTITIAGTTFTYTQGTISAGSSEIYFSDAAHTLSGTNGSNTLNNVKLVATGANRTYTISNTITIAGTLSLVTTSTNALTINTGTINAQGDITISSGTGVGGGSATININGTGDQTLTGSGTSNVGLLPIVTINKSSGTLNLSSTISVAGNWTFTAGAVNMGSATVYMAGTTWTYTAGTITPGTSLVNFSDANHTVTGTHSLNSVTFNGSGTRTITISNGTILTAAGTLSLTTTSTGTLTINTGEIDVQGDVTISSGSGAGGGTATIMMNGTGTQTLTGSGTSNVGDLPNFTINKSSGTLNLASVISISGTTWTYTQGTVSAGTSTVYFTNASHTISGSHTLANVQLNGGTTTINGGTILTTTATLTIAGSSSSIINTGEIDAQGDVTVTNSNTGTGTATIVFNGTVDQTFTGPSTANQAWLPNIIINKSSGTLNLVNTISVADDWTYTQGTVNTGSSTVYFTGNNAHAISGTQSFNNLTLNSPVTYTFGTSNVISVTDTLTYSSNTTIVLTGTATINANNVTFNHTSASFDSIGSNITFNVSGTLTFAGGSNASATGGTINAQGDITVTNTATSGQLVATLNINGTGTQTLTGPGSTNNQGRFGSVTINKASGTLNLVNTISVASAWTYTQGTVSPGSSTVYFSDAAHTISGTQSLNNVYFDTTTTARTITVSTGTVLTVTGTLTLGGGTGSLTFNTGEIDAQGDVTVTNTGTAGGGTATVAFTGTGTQTLTGPGSTSNQGRLPSININKLSGTLNLINTISAGTNWTYTQGTVSAGSSTVYFTSASHTITGSNTLNNVEFAGGNTTISGGTILTVGGTLTLSGSGNNNVLNTGDIYAQGDINTTNTGTITGTAPTATITINGTGDQTWTGSGVGGEGNLPNINISKPSGTLNLVSIISVTGNWIYNSGALNAGSSTVFFNNNSAAKTITGSNSLNNVTFNGGTIAISSGTILTVAGTLTFSGTTFTKINTGDIYAKGDITITATGSSTSQNDGTITINGTGTQTLTGSGTAGVGVLPNIKIDKSSGTLNLVSVISVEYSWTYVQGTESVGTSTLVFTGSGTITEPNTLNNLIFSETNIYSINGSFVYVFTGDAYTLNSDINVSGTMTINNVVLNGTQNVTAAALAFGDSSLASFSSGINCVVSGALSFSGTAQFDFVAGTIHAHGDINDSNTGTAVTVPVLTGTILIDGTGDQTLTGSGLGIASPGISAPGGRLPIVAINKASGTLHLASVIGVGGNWNYTTGTVDAGSSTVIFRATTATLNLTVTGSNTLNNVIFYNNNFTNTYNISTGTILTVGGTLTVSSAKVSTAGGVVLNSGEIDAQGDITVATGTSTAGGGTTFININGSGTQTLTGEGVAGQGVLPNIQISKTSGTLNLSSIISVAGNWTYVQGTVAPGTSTVVFTTAGTSVVTGTQSFNNLTATTSGGTLNFNAGDTITINGLLTLTNVTVGSTTSSQWFINHQGTESATGITLSNSGCDPASTNIDYSGSNGGNNGTCWVHAATVSSAPLNLADSVGSSSISLTWSSPASDGGSAITDYVVEYELTVGGGWATFNDGTSTATTATVTGLSDGTSYDFRVSALNGVGTSSPSSTVSATPGEPAQVIIQGFSVLTAPIIKTNIRITNEGSSAYEYQYTWCVTDSNGNDCGGGDDVFSSTAAKLIQPSTDFDTTLSSNIPTEGNYYFHIDVTYGSDSSSAVQSFTAAAASGSGGGGGGGFTPAPAPTPTPSPTTGPAPAPTPTSVPDTSTHPDGTLILIGQTVYLIQDNQRYAFRNQEELQSRGYNLNDVVPATTADLSLPFDPSHILKAMIGTLVLDKSDGRTVYIIGLNSTKRGFVSENVFYDLGYNFDHIPKIDLSDYPVGAVIKNSTDAHPDGALVLDKDGTIWWIINDQRHGFASQSIFQTYDFSSEQVVPINPADSNLPLGPLVEANNLSN